MLQLRTPRLHSVTEGNVGQNSRQEPLAGTEEVMECHLLAYSPWFVQPAFLYKLGPPLSMGDNTHSEPGTPISVNNQENAPQANMVGAFSLLKFPLPK